MSEKQKTFWPYGIVLGIIGVFIMSIGTVVFALKNPVQEANDFMDKYQTVDNSINDKINANIAFRKHYKAVYSTKRFDENHTAISYKVTTLDGKAVNDATFEAILTRPDEVQSDITLSIDKVENGLYTFKPVTLTKQGRWNIFMYVSVGKYKGYERLKLDTRYPTADPLPFDIAIVMN